jgi:DNA-binding response OmpR family regulator
VTPLITLVVDCPAHGAELARQLAGQPLELCHTDDPAAALLLMGRRRPDVVLLGPTTGHLDPVAFLDVVRAHEPELPVILGVGPGGGAVASDALAHGALAALPHPYQVTSLLRLLSSLAPVDRPVTFRPLPIDLGRLRIDGAEPAMWLDGTRRHLPMREFLLLRYLAERVDTVVSRTEIALAVWGWTGARDDSSLTVHVLRLRRRLGDNRDNPRWITSVRGLGYRFTVPPPEVASRGRSARRDDDPVPRRRP